jgi:hypothetical protein
MARRNPGRTPLIGKRWPYKSLNYLPTRQLWKYLTWKSGGTQPEAPFHLGKSLSEARRILVVLPDGFQEILVAFPMVQCLVQDLPGSEFLFLTGHDLAGFVSALFGPDRVLGMRPEEFYWGEVHFRELVARAAGFRADVSINLREDAPPLMHYLLRTSAAPIRVEVSGEEPRPFANLILKPSDPSNHLKRFLQAVLLWNFSDRPITPMWSRLGVSPENLKEAQTRLVSKGVRPESTRLFLWQDGDQALQRELFQAAVSERSSQGAAKSLVVVNGAGPLLATPPPPQDLVTGLPGMEVESIGLLLGLFSQTAYSIGINGPLVQLAGIADTDVEAHFRPEEAVWDTAFLNPRLKVKYREESKSPGAVEAGE